MGSTGAQQPSKREQAPDGRRAPVTQLMTHHQASGASAPCRLCSAPCSAPREHATAHLGPQQRPLYRRSAECRLVLLEASKHPRQDLLEGSKGHATPSAGARPDRAVRERMYREGVREWRRRQRGRAEGGGRRAEGGGRRAEGRGRRAGSVQTGGGARVVCVQLERVVAPEA